MAITPLGAAFFARCPACGKGKLFSGFLRVAARCGVCGLSFERHEKGDGPAFFAIVFVGALVTVLAAVTDMIYAPPYWVHFALWGPLIVLLCLFFLRFFKALIIAMQHMHGRL